MGLAMIYNIIKSQNDKSYGVWVKIGVLQIIALLTLVLLPFVGIDYFSRDYLFWITAIILVPGYIIHWYRERKLHSELDKLRNLMK
jgi:general stress protein CsbA